MSIEVRTLDPAEFQAAIGVISTAFLDRPDTAAVAAYLQGKWDPDRSWGALDGARICGTFRSFGTEITVPGGALLPAAAVSAVTVLPTHRRRGILTAMAARAHAGMRERGEALGLLYAAEYPIYGRFGYGPMARHANITLRTRQTGFLGQPAGGVELVDGDETTRDTLRDVHEIARLRRAGEIRRRPFTWDARVGLVEEPWDGRWKGFIALRRDAAGTVDGYLRYKAKASWDEHQPNSTIEVEELVTLTAEAYGALWRFLAESDLVTIVKADGRPEDDPLPWLLTNARAAKLDLVDGMWVRLFDLPRALEARTYERQAALVLEVPDPLADAGRWRLALDASPDGTTCQPTDRSPDVVVPLNALSAAYLGGTRLRNAVRATGAEEVTAGSLAALDALLRTDVDPWCSTFF